MFGVHRNRLTIQALTACVTNGYVHGFVTGKVFGGPTKVLCVPWLNCYSCPGALASCPIGSLQTALGGSSRGIPFYVMGLLVLFGTILGRLVCGFLCPFGFVQDLLHRIPLPKLSVPHKLDRVLRYAKYVVATCLVICLPIMDTILTGRGAPYFCKFLCPAGTLEGALPLMLAKPQLQSQIGVVFWWKVAVLVVVILVAICIERPFCKYLCPLGAFYGLFNKVSFYQMHVDKKSCVSCGACSKACPMGVDPATEANSPECIRCGTCKVACPTSAIVAGFELRARNELAKQAACHAGGAQEE